MYANEGLWKALFALPNVMDENFPQIHRKVLAAAGLACMSREYDTLLKLFGLSVKTALALS